MDVLNASLMELEEKNVQIKDIKQAISQQSAGRSQDGEAAKNNTAAMMNAAKDIEHIMQMIASLNALAKYDNFALANEIYKEILSDCKSVISTLKK